MKRRCPWYFSIYSSRWLIETSHAKTNTQKRIKNHFWIEGWVPSTNVFVTLSDILVANVLPLPLLSCLHTMAFNYGAHKTRTSKLLAHVTFNMLVISLTFAQLKSQAQSFHLPHADLGALLHVNWSSLGQ